MDRDKPGDAVHSGSSAAGGGGDGSNSKLLYGSHSQTFPLSLSSPFFPLPLMYKKGGF